MNTKENYYTYNSSFKVLINYNFLIGALACYFDGKVTHTAKIKCFCYLKAYTYFDYNVAINSKNQDSNNG